MKGGTPPSVLKDEVRTCMVYSFGFCVKSGGHEAVVSGSFLWPAY